MSQQYQDPNDWLMRNAGKNVSFDGPIGTHVTGFVLRQPEMVQAIDFETRKPKFWDNGDPVMVMRVVLDTDELDPNDPEDAGHRTLYIRGGNMQRAVQEAVIKAGAQGIEVGGKLRVTYSGNGEVTRRGGQAPKLYTAQYKKPEPVAMMPPAQPAEAQSQQGATNGSAQAPQPAQDPIPF